MSPEILRIVGDASFMQPETSSVSASDRNPGEAIAETSPMDVILSPICVDRLKISDEEEEGSGISDPVKSVGVVYSMQPETSSSNPRLRYLAEAISRKGFKVKTNWWDSNLSYIDAMSSSDTHALSMTFERLLYSDMNLYGGGVLPHNIGCRRVQVLVGPCVLQVEAIVDVGWDTRRRLQLSMTDGVHQVIGLERRRIENLQDSDPAGLKIVVFNLPVWNGVLMLVPDRAVVLGGRVVEKVNKPPRGDHVNTSTTTNASHAQATGQGVPLNVISPQIDYASIEATFAKIESIQLDTPSLPRDREEMVGEWEVEDVAEWEVEEMVEYESESESEWEWEWETLPFTNFAGLTEKSALTKDPVRGVIKGCVYGIKFFGVKPSGFDVVFYVRDACLKHEILLHDGFVDKFLDQSASLAEELNRLALFLSSFEGMMLVEMNRSSQYPVAVEMIEGCSLTDAKLLFERITTTSCN